MRRLARRISIFMCFVMLSIFIMGSITVSAAGNSNWVYQGEDVWVLQDGAGTNITASIRDKVLYIKGTGAIPDCTGDEFGKRPWHGKTIYKLYIEEGITSIGMNAFAGLKYLHEISMYLGTFVEDASAFAGLTQGTIFYINGMNIIDRNIGSIPYTNIDYLTSFMQQKNGMYNFRVANHYIAGLIQSKANPKIQNLSQLDVKTDASNPNYPLIDYSNTLTILSGDTSNIASKSIISCMQGKEALTAFSLVIGDNKYATAYNITMSDKTGPIKQVATPYQIQISVPAALRYPGRQFTLIQLGQGTINMLQDEDMDDTTITFTTSQLTSVCALTYKDVVQ